MINIIELTKNESSLYNQIPFNKKVLALTHDEIITGSEGSALLVNSLLRRKAIPEIRLEYFNNPVYNIHSKRSHKKIFELNGTLGREIFRHPHFWPYLYYWIHSPDLLGEIIDKFFAIISEETYISGSDMPTICDFVRSETRNYGLDPKIASDEFYTLALECGIAENFARMIRDYVRAVQ